MKNRILGLLALTGLILGTQSCKEEITVSSDFTETAVVYGLMDTADSLHMIKITRAYIGPGDAIQFAKIPDSSYFPALEGTVTEYINGNVARVFTLKDTTVLNKEENGIFYAPTQKLYYFATNSSSPLISNAEYKLDLDINNGEFQVTSTTALVNSMSEDKSSKNQPFRFILSNGDYASTEITVQNGTSMQNNCRLDVEFTEWIGTVPTVKSFRWNLGEKVVEGGSSMSFLAEGLTFYELMRSNVTNNPAITKRTFNGITLEVTGGSQDLANYILINKPSSSLAQTKPTFTNLEATKGHPVVGIFTSTQTVKTFIPFIGGTNFIRCINSASTEYLCTGAQTFDLLFCSDHPGDALNPTWFCQ